LQLPDFPLIAETEKVRWLYVEGNGEINELSINSNINTLKLRIVIDDNEVYNELTFMKFKLFFLILL